MNYSNVKVNIGNISSPPQVKRLNITGFKSLNSKKN